MEFKHHLKSMFIPRSVAVVGASDREGSQGTCIWASVMGGRLALETYPVNPKYKYLGITPCWSSLKELPKLVDLAVIVTPTEKVKTILQECAFLHIHNVLIAPGDETYTADPAWRKDIYNFASANAIRLLGPDSTGIMRPGIGLNVSFWTEQPRPGSVGLVCQSGSITHSVLDYSQDATYGFSSIITSGAEEDVSLPEIIDFLTGDPDTKVIALHLESVRYPHEFYSALRTACRVKPVVVLKAGIGPSAAALVSSRMDVASGDDRAFEAMLIRAGAIRCSRIEEFCATIELLAKPETFLPGRLAIVANGLGYSTLAADALDANKITLATYSDSLKTKLSAVTHNTETLTNPFNIGTLATAEKFTVVAKALLEEENVDALLLAVSPSAVLKTNALVAALLSLIRTPKKTIFLVCPTSNLSEELRAQLQNAKIPIFRSIALATRAYMNRCLYEETVRLRFMPPSEGTEVMQRNVTGARLLVEEVRGEKRHFLQGEENHKLLNIFGINTPRDVFVATLKEALNEADQLSYPLAMKLDTPALDKKIEHGGVILDCQSEEDIEKGFATLKTVADNSPVFGKFKGVLLQQMVSRPNARALCITVTRDSILGPVFKFGAGGASQILNNKYAMQIAPLNGTLARHLIDTSPVADELKAVRGMPQVNMDELVRLLMNVSHIVSEIPAIQTLVLNPVLADENGTIVLDSDFILGEAKEQPHRAYEHLLIPLPPRSEKTLDLDDDKGLRLRSVLPGDFFALQRFFERCPYKPNVSPESLIDLTQIDYACETGLVLVDASAKPEIRAYAHLMPSHVNTAGVFEIYVENAYRNKKLEAFLIDRIEEDAHKFGLKLLQIAVPIANSSLLVPLTSMGYMVDETSEAGSIINYKKII